MVSQELIKELQQIIREEYKIDLELNETSQVAREFSSLFDLLAEINYENTKESNNLISQIENTSDSAIIKQTEKPNTLPK